MKKTIFVLLLFAVCFTVSIYPKPSYAHSHWKGIKNFWSSNHKLLGLLMINTNYTKKSGHYHLKTILNKIKNNPNYLEHRTNYKYALITVLNGNDFFTFYADNINTIKPIAVELLNTVYRRKVILTEKRNKWCEKFYINAGKKCPSYQNAYMHKSGINFFLKKIGD